MLKAVGDGPFRFSDVAKLGVSPRNLSYWAEKGLVERVARGLYRFPDAEFTELATVAEVSKRAPKSTICLLSALVFHQLGVESPSSVWLMIERHARAPKIDFVSTEVVRASGAALSHGVELHTAEGVEVPITSPAKTVADCFRYRRHVGLEVALDALRDYMRKFHARSGTRYSTKAIIDAAKADRVWPLMRPYLEAMV